MLFVPFWSHAFYFYVEFEQKTCILHHFAFLFAHQFTKIHRPKNSFQQVKSPFLGVFWPSKSEDFAPFSALQSALSSTFCTILPCVLLHFTLRLARVSTAFTRRQHCVLLHIAVHFAANSPKTSRKHGLFQRKFVFSTIKNKAYFHPSKPSRESFICQRAHTWLQISHSQC